MTSLELEQSVLNPHPVSRLLPWILWAIGILCFTSGVLYPLSPVPFALIGIFYNRRMLLLFSILSAVLIFLISGSFQGILLFSFGIGMAWTWSELSKLKIPLFNYLIISVCSCFVLLSIALFLVSHGNIPAYLNNFMLSEIKQLLAAPPNQYPQFLYQDDVREMFSKNPEKIVFQISQLLPGIVGALVVLLSWGVVSIAKARRAIIHLSLPISLTHWSTPPYLIWAIVVSLPLAIWGGNTFRVFGLTTLLIVGSCYFLHGFSIIRFWFLTRRVAGWIRAVLYFLIFIFYPFTAATIGFGLFDPLMHFRERIQSTDIDEEKGELV